MGTSRGCAGVILLPRSFLFLSELGDLERGRLRNNVKLHENLI
jgi:hypothetical protein